MCEIAEHIGKCGIYYGDALFVSPNRQWRYKRRANFLSLTRKNICHQTIFYPIELFRMGNRYNLKYPILADWALNLKAYKIFSFYRINRIICCFDTEGVSFSSKKDYTFLNDLPFIIKQNLGYIALGYYELRQFIKKILFLR